MSNEMEYKDIVAFHPGSYIEDIIDDLNITQAEFAERLDISAKTVSKIVNGEENISNNVARKLSNVTGISVVTWLNLQAKYDSEIIKIKEQRINGLEKRICEEIDLKTMKKFKIIKDGRYNFQEKKSILKRLFKISDLTQLLKFNSSVSYRIKDINEKSIINSNAMLEIASNKARDTTNNKFNKNKLEKVLPIIKSMVTRLPEDFYSDLKNILLDCGIVLVSMPKFKNAGLNGATKRFKNGSVLLLVTDRGKDADIFWFSLIHEIAHIYNNEFYSDIKKNDDKYQKIEKEADNFSANFFIPCDKYKKFIDKNEFTKKSIKDFAKDISMTPGIVVGRLQNDEFISHSSFNDLKIRFRVVPSSL